MVLLVLWGRGMRPRATSLKHLFLGFEFSIKYRYSRRNVLEVHFPKQYNAYLRDFPIKNKIQVP